MAENEIPSDFTDLLAYLQQSRGIDFAAYKPNSLQRRVAKRMATVGVKSFVDYKSYLEIHSEEFAALFDTILINVTSFFRDRESWDYLAEHVVPTILANRPTPEVIRIWCAGVASGEEAYSVIMQFAEAMGQENVRDRVKIYATDADEQALNQARQATYDSAAMENVPDNLRNKYFDQVGNTFVFRLELRGSIIFGRHDLMRDAPISHLDMIVCRNTLMYFNSDAQEKILQRFHFALNPGGFLFLGRAEMLLTHAALFMPFDLRNRVFTKQMRVQDRDSVTLLTLPAERDAVQQVSATARARSTSFDHAPIAMIHVDNAGIITLANALARSMFMLGPSNLPRPFSDLELTYRPDELRSKIEQARMENRPIMMQQVYRSVGTDKLAQYLDIQVIPLNAPDGTSMGNLIAFADATAVHNLMDEANRAKQDAETAYEALQSANEELQTANEELQSSNEELQTTNEELHSTNEELETMNEELQSTNEELEAINSELAMRTSELDDMSGFLQTALDNLHAGVIVVNEDSKVLLWNRQAFELWGLRHEETRGRSLFHLDFGLPTSGLATPIQDCMRGDCPKVMELDATTRRGEKVRCCVSMSRIVGTLDGRIRVMLMMDVSPLS